MTVHLFANGVIFFAPKTGAALIRGKKTARIHVGVVQPPRHQMALSCIMKGVSLRKCFVNFTAKFVTKVTLY